MANYEKVYDRPYTTWKDAPDETTPITASVLNNQSDAIEAIETYLSDNPIPDSSASGTTDYEDLSNKPKINGVELTGDLTSEELGISGSSTSGTTDYEDLSNKPSIEGVSLTGDKNLSDFGSKKIIKIDWDDYKLLSDENKNDENIAYLVKNYPDNEITGNDIPFDAGTTDLAAEDINGAIIEVNSKTDTATSIAKGRNQSRVFVTFSALEAWLSNEEKMGLCKTGDNLYIVELDVPDYWIVEALEEVDADTGYYYKIAPLETQKVDLTDIENELTALETGLSSVSNKLYSGLSAAMSALGVTFSSGTTLELFNVLPANTDITFYVTSSIVTDLPTTYGVLHLMRVGSSDNNKNAVYYGVADRTTWRYKYHSTATANNGWIKLSDTLDLDAKADASVVGQQSSLPLPTSTFAYNISQNADNISEIETIANSNTTNLNNYLLACAINTPAISSSGYVSTTDSSSFVRYYKVGIMTCVQVSLLVTKEISALTSINLVTGLPAANISNIGFLQDLNGNSYSVQIDTNGVNLHTYAYNQLSIPVNTRLIGTFWYARKTL